MNIIYNQDCLKGMKILPDKSIYTCVTSPPYFGLRDYGVDGQVGMEQTPDEYVTKLVNIFREVWRALRDDGTLWLNLGDSYATGKPKNTSNPDLMWSNGQSRRNVQGAKHKDLLGIPWRVAFALQADGWYLRQDIIWSKPNPMPESVKDRCTKSHEYIFLLSKSPRYYYDSAAVAEPVATSTIARLAQQGLVNQQGSNRVPGKTNRRMKAVPPRFGGNKYGNSDDIKNRTKSGNAYDITDGKRNRRSVWTVSTKPFKEAHFATFPPDLIEPCILAGCPEGGIVLDPFMGAGTTAVTALGINRQYVGFELNPDYCVIAEKRITTA